MKAHGLGPSRRGAGRRLEWGAEWLIVLVSYAAVFAIALIFLFVAKEALPLLWDRGELSLADLVLPRAFPGYDSPAFVWQPIAFPPKFNLVPLLLGTLKITSLAMLVSAPLGVLAAIHVACFLPSGLRLFVKPVVELLAGFPSVVIGYVALIWLSDVTQSTLGTTYRLNATVAALALSITVVPLIFTVSEDALRGVPAAYQEASAALGARPWQTVLFVVVPAALPGIAAALVLGLGRALGETMIVLLASGNAAVMSWNPTSSGRTLTATIAAELGEAPRGSEHWRVLFLLGLVLFGLTLTLDSIGQAVVRGLQRRLDPHATEST